MPTRAIAQERMPIQRLFQTDFTTTLDVVRHLVALQSQDYYGSLWSLGLRLPQTTLDIVQQAYTDRTIIRTWSLRGTLFIIAAEDVWWLLDLVAPRLLSGSAARYRKLGLDETTISTITEIVICEMEGGKQLTRNEIFEALGRHNIETGGERGMNIMYRLALEKVMCLGDMRGKQQTYVLLNEWSPQTKFLSREDAAIELMTRYFASRAPATFADFVWWSGLPIGEARAALDTIESRLVSETIGAETYYRLASIPVKYADKSESPLVHLLPPYDEWMLGYKDRTNLLDSQYESQVFLGNGYSAMIAIDGIIAGIWRRSMTNKKVSIEYHPFAPFSDAEQAALMTTAQNYGEFLGLETSLQQV